MNLASDLWGHSPPLPLENWDTGNESETFLILLTRRSGKSFLSGNILYIYSLFMQKKLIQKQNLSLWTQTTITISAFSSR
jgi:hypothetical protein